MVLDVLRSYNITQFLNVFAHFLSKAFAVSGSSFAQSFWRKAVRNPPKLIAQFCFASR